jgi:hypothetical protein
MEEGHVAIAIKAKEQLMGRRQQLMERVAAGGEQVEAEAERLVRIQVAMDVMARIIPEEKLAESSVARATKAILEGFRKATGF